MSNVSGENLNLLKTFLNLLTTRMEYHENEPAEFQIDDTYSVPVWMNLSFVVPFIIRRVSGSWYGGVGHYSEGCY